MTEVWLPIVTLLIGYAGSLWTESRRDRRLGEREERAREAERERSRDLRRSQFQRESLLELQDALQRLMRSTGEIHHHDVMKSREAGEWVRTLLGPELNQRNHDALVDVRKLYVRVDDEELRSLVQKLIGESTISDATLASTEAAARAALRDAIQTYERVSERLGELLRGTF